MRELRRQRCDQRSASFGAASPMTDVRSASNRNLLTDGFFFARKFFCAGTVSKFNSSSLFWKGMCISVDHFAAGHHLVVYNMSVRGLVKVSPHFTATSAVNVSWGNFPGCVTDFSTSCAGGLNILLAYIHISLFISIVIYVYRCRTACEFFVGIEGCLHQSEQPWVFGSHFNC